MTHAVQMHSATRNRVHIKGSGVIKLRAATEHVTIYGAHGLPVTVELSDDTPAGAIVQFRRRNDYAGQPYQVVDSLFAPVATLARHGHDQVLSVQRTLAGWQVI